MWGWIHNRLSVVANIASVQSGAKAVLGLGMLVNSVVWQGIMPPFSVPSPRVVSSRNLDRSTNAQNDWTRSVGRLVLVARYVTLTLFAGGTYFCDATRFANGEVADPRIVATALDNTVGAALPGCLDVIEVVYLCVRIRHGRKLALGPFLIEAYWCARSRG